jgi:hypothetical protein
MVEAVPNVRANAPRDTGGGLGTVRRRRQQSDDVAQLLEEHRQNRDWHPFVCCGARLVDEGGDHAATAK